MSLEAARMLSIPELLRVLNEKLGLEHSRVQEASLVVMVGSLEPEVRSRRLARRCCEI